MSDGWVDVGERVEVNHDGDWVEGVVVGDRRFYVTVPETVTDDDGNALLVERQELHESADVQLADGVHHVTIHSAGSRESGPDWRR